MAENETEAPKVVRDFGDIEAVEKTRILPDIGNICRMEFFSRRHDRLACDRLA